MPINYNKLTTELIVVAEETTFMTEEEKSKRVLSEEYKTICEMAKRNDFYYHQLKGFRCWENQDTADAFVIKYDDKIIGYFTTNYKTAEGYMARQKPLELVFNKMNRMPTTIWIELFLIDKPYQNLGIGTYIMNDFNNILKKQFGNDIKWVCYDVDLDKPKQEILKLMDFYSKKRKAVLLNTCNRAGNLMFCESLNKIEPLLKEINDTGLKLEDEDEEPPIAEDSFLFNGSCSCDKTPNNDYPCLCDNEDNIQGEINKNEDFCDNYGRKIDNYG